MEWCYCGKRPENKRYPTKCDACIAAEIKWLHDERRKAGASGRGPSFVAEKPFGRQVSDVVLCHVDALQHAANSLPRSNATPLDWGEIGVRAWEDSEEQP